MLKTLSNHIRLYHINITQAASYFISIM